MVDSRIAAIGIAALLVASPACSDDDAQSAPTRDAAIQRDAGPDVAAPDAAPDAEPDAAEPAAMRVAPEQLFFENVEIGESRTLAVSVRNVGGSPLYLTSAELTDVSSADAAELTEGAGYPGGEPVEIAPGTTHEVEVVYAPADHAVDRAALDLYTTDSDNSHVVVPIQTINAYADIDAPETLRFGSVDAGESVTEEVVVYNRGLDPLTVESITASGDPSFSVAMKAPYQTPAILQTDDFLVFEATYAPQTTDTVRSTVTIASDDPDQSSFELTLVGNEPTPCIRLSKNAVEFGEVPVGERRTQPLTILNCSQSRQLAVSTIALSTDGGGAFSFNQAPGLPLELAPLTTEQVQLAASADDPRAAAGVLVVQSDDPQQPSIVVDVSAVFVE